MEPKAKKPKKKPGLKLKITEEHKAPLDWGIGVGDESKAADSIQSNSSFQSILIDKEQIDILDEMNKFAPQVQGKLKTNVKFYIINFIF